MLRGTPGCCELPGLLICVLSTCFLSLTRQCCKLRNLASDYPEYYVWICLDTISLSQLRCRILKIQLDDLIETCLTEFGIDWVPSDDEDNAELFFQTSLNWSEFDFYFITKTG